MQKTDTKTNIITLILTIMVLFFIIEVSLRIFYPQPLVKHKDLEVGPKIFNESSYLPWQLRAAVVQRHVSVLDEFDVLVNVNSLGYRDDEFNIEKEDDVKRIVVVGDSMTFGWGVENDETYPKILEKFLNSDKEKYEVINAGYKSGYSIDTEYLYFKKEGLELKPDMLIVGFLVRNDFTDYKGHIWTYNKDGGIEKIESKKQYVDSEHRLRTRENRTSLNRILYDTNVFISSYSHFYVLFKNSFKGILERFSLGRETGVYSEEYNQEVKKDIETTFSLLLKFKELAEKNNVKLVVVLIPNREGVYDYKTDGINWTKPHEILVDFGKDNDIEVIDLFSDLKEEKERSRKGLYFKIDRHLNAEGHYLIGKSIYKKLKEIKLI